MIEKSASSTNQHTPLVLIILDGWGHCDQVEYNAIAAAHAPFWQHLWKTYPHTLAEASGPAVGLPDGQMGNSEVGHLHMGTGRLVEQDLTRINNDIASGGFHQNAAFVDAIDHLIAKNHALHILGLLSPGGVHSQENHIFEVIKIAAERGLKKIYLHAFLDGRDTPPRSAKESIDDAEKLFQSIHCGKIASIIGRYYAMDRDKRWKRTERAYDLLTQGDAAHRATSAIDGLRQAYDRGESDEFVLPTAICAENENPVVLEDGDAIIFMNFRADRARQLTHALTDKTFSAFSRKRFPVLSSFITLTEYATDILAKPAYPRLSFANFFGEYISKLGYQQLRIAETEKYAHVTFFFNGGEETPCLGEDRILIPSPKVATYDLQPEMSAPELTDRLIEAIKSKRYDAIICNFANPDMVGHTGDFIATIKAIEVISESLERIVRVLESEGGEALITADHGNAECMFDVDTRQPHTAHTTNLVPVVYVGRKAIPTTEKGVLYDIAPTLVYLMGLEQPAEMTGRSLFKKTFLSRD
ncbi:MAG: yibO [Gammaproteobacteria bacterium]|jgi:2,3-bisphosphoglycerate-independent phosphoglycerate mutase|nr:yibO [Gammaproteobacteria bacterium]